MSRLLRAAMARLAPDGVLLFSNNFRRFRLDEEAVAEFAQVHDISAQTIDAGFRAQPAHPSGLGIEAPG